MMRPGWRTGRYRANGIDFHVVEAGRPGDPLVMLFHGFPEFWWAWRHQLTPLAEAGFHVVAPDLRGFNRSDAPRDVSAYRLDVLAADVLALADALQADRFHLVGHDWGAVIGWWTAAQHPARLDGAVLISGPHPAAWAGQVRGSPLQAIRSAYVALFQLPWIPEATLAARNFAGLRSAMRRSARRGSLGREVLDRYAEAWTRPGSLTGMLNYYRALRRQPNAKLAASIAPRTLVLWGDRDRFLGRGVMEASVAYCKNGRFVPIEGATHWLHWENSERITAEILNFLQSASTETPATEG